MLLVFSIFSGELYEITQKTFIKMSDLGLKYLVKTSTKTKLFKNHICDVMMTYKELYSTPGCPKMAFVEQKSKS